MISSQSGHRGGQRPGPRSATLALMNTHSEAPRKPRYGEGRQALLDAAVQVVGRSGLRGLTYRAVAAEAGVTQGLVAHHFGSRDRLIHEALLAAGAQSIG